MYRNAAAIGADIGRDSIRVATVTMDGGIRSSETCSLPGKLSKDLIITALSEAVRSERQRAAGLGINTISVGIAARGFVNQSEGIILGPDHGVKGWKNVPVARIISLETGLPAFVGNDANLMTIAEQRFGAARGYKNVIFIALRTGIGGGIIINGKLYRGVNNAGGEIGQMIINFKGGKSDTGINGSLEYYASGTALYENYRTLSAKVSETLNAREVINLAASGDKNAQAVLSENAEMVGIGVANLVAIFAPEMIVIGGSLPEAGKKYIAAIRRSAFRNSLPSCRAEVRIEPAGLGQNASLIGAGFYSLMRLAGKQI
jgi:glucokinase